MDEKLKHRVIETLKTIYDPEISINIYDLGLIYDLEISENGNVRVLMTLTAPNCPEAESLPLMVKMKVENVYGVREVTVDITFDPPWSFEKLSEEARLELGFM